VLIAFSVEQRKEQIVVEFQLCTSFGKLSGGD
jgi:hypothetical protein